MKKYVINDNFCAKLLKFHFTVTDTVFVFSTAKERDIFMDSLGYFGCDCFFIPKKYFNEYGSLQIGFLQKNYNIEIPKRTGDTLLNFSCDHRELQAVYQTIENTYLITRFIRWRYDCINNRFYINSNVVKRIEIP